MSSRMHQMHDREHITQCEFVRHKNIPTVEKYSFIFKERRKEKVKKENKLEREGVEERQRKEEKDRHLHFVMYIT